MAFWWRVVPFFVLCHFCSSNGSKVTGLHIQALHMTSVSDIFPSNDWKRQTKSYISIYWTDRETENIGEMSPWPPNFPHCALLPIFCKISCLSNGKYIVILWNIHYSVFHRMRYFAAPCYCMWIFSNTDDQWLILFPDMGDFCT